MLSPAPFIPKLASALARLLASSMAASYWASMARLIERPSQADI